MAHRDEMVFANENRRLTVSYAFCFADQIRRAGHNEELVAINFDFGTLVRLQRILNRERMKNKTLLKRAKLSFGRLEKADPNELRFVVCENGWRIN
jgi:hypothetical protein